MGTSLDGTIETAEARFKRSFHNDPERTAGTPRCGPALPLAAAPEAE
jgi:hypothetical protein